jgi:nitroimidazol reductase NimA-like FMN-containing flavoprotein (pyridoxamine 5'-phosphate oxidase superfamily)
MDENYREKARALIGEQVICVLATASGNRPHCSLMAYASNAPCTEIYMVTMKDSRKYRNMCANPAVSLLIDNRQGTSTSYTDTLALNLSGRFQPIIEATQKKKILEVLSKRHPALVDLFDNPGGEPVKIIIESILLLEGATNAYYGIISKSQN